jgi:hypothetical protein
MASSVVIRCIVTAAVAIGVALPSSVSMAQYAGGRALDSTSTHNFFASLTQRRLGAIARGDRAAWSAIVDDDATLSYYDGRRLTKAEAAAAIVPPDPGVAALSSDSEVVDSLAVHPLGEDVAVVSAPDP